MKRFSWAKAFKARTGLPTLTGGYEAKVYPDELMSHGCFDYLCAGTAHVFLPEFLTAFETGRGMDRVPGLYYRKAGSVARTTPAAHVPFSSFPTPDRSIFPNHLYYSHISQRKNFTIGMSEVGCPYPCSFCCMRLSGYDARSAEQVVDEMEECVRLGIREIDWFDPLMLHDRQRAMDIANGVKARKLDIIWSCRSRVDSMSFHKSHREPDTELIETLASGGCRRIYFGIESGDDTVLKTMMKGQVAADPMRRTLQCVQEAGIMSLGFFIIGAPGDTAETVRKTIDFSLTLPIAYAQYQIAIIKPHTELERTHIINGTGIDYWREYVKGTVDEMLLPTPWTQLDRAEMEALARQAYLRFYSRPRYAWQMLKKIESATEMKRYARVGAQLVLRPLRQPATESGVSPLPLRAARATATFLEAGLTLLSSGARHEVFKEGGGVRGAWTLARREFKGSTPTPVVLAEGAVPELRVAGVSTAVDVAALRIDHDRYAPVFETAPDAPTRTQRRRRD